MTREIKLTQGYITLVDDDLYETLNAHKWCIQRSGNIVYASRGIWTANSVKHIRMHRIVIGADPGIYVDHINGNALDNQRANLRLCTYAENNRNRRVRRADNTSGYKGVSWHIRRNKWHAHIRHEGRLQHLGYFDDPISAARAYDAAAIEMFGAFARINFPVDDLTTKQASAAIESLERQTA
jgi:hypothetical protein